MRRKTTRLGVWMLTISLALGCTQGPAGTQDYRPLLLGERLDPLAGEKTFVPWRAPQQMAAFVHPHEDREQGILIAGHWVLILLGEGSWYFQEPLEREPVPDAEASPEDVRRALGALGVPQGAVIPYRPHEGGKP